MNDETKALLEQARAAGCIFYRMPWELHEEPLDSLILPAVKRINESGWCWTAESCAGHPDAIEAFSWAHNTDPMLRLITQAKDAGRMLHELARAYRAVSDAIRIFEVGGIRLCPSPFVKEPWFEVLVYLGARNSYQRNQGVAIFNVFSEAVCATNSSAS